jgi:hypothetical protein
VRAIASRPAGLPDGLFLYQKSQLGYILEGLGIDNVGIFYDHLEYFTAVRYNLWQFGIVCSYLVHFSRFGILYQENSGNPAAQHQVGDQLIGSGQRKV